MGCPEILTIHLPHGLVAPPVNPYGRQVANAGVFRALARHGGYRGIHVQSLDPLPVDRLTRELFPSGTDADVALSTGTPLSTEVPSRGGILLSKDASDPILRGGNQIDDDLLRATPQGGVVKLAPVKRR